MKFFALLFVIALAFAQSYPEEDGVIVLNDSTFDAAVEEFGSLLVEFYAPWCGHCKKLAPEYAAAAKTLAGMEPAYKIAKVDATSNPKLSNKYQIQGFPTLKFIRGETISDYEGGRVAKEIVDFVVRKSGPIGKKIEDAEELVKLTADNDVVFVAHCAEESECLKEYLNVAATVDDLVFAYVVDPAISAQLIADVNTIVVNKKFDELSAVLTGDLTSETISKFVHKHELPLVIPFNQKNARKIFSPSSGIESQCIIFAEDDEEGKEELNTFSKVSAAHQGEEFFVSIPVENTRLMDYFGVTLAELPAVVMIKNTQGGMKKYKFEGEFTEEELNQFVNNYNLGKLTPFLKSEPIPETQNGPVYTIVGKSFNDIALDETKNVLIKFYAPWCGHCKALAPAYIELAKSLADRKDIIIAEMDATANEVDHPEVQIRGFPTIKFFPAGSSKVMSYEGDRSAEAMKKFVLENSVEVEEPKEETEAKTEEEL
ncbi:hypothetical protein WA158_006516 [Blastocystis sp. Blastoise]